MIRVLLTTFPGAFLHQGGGEREMFLLKEELERFGIVVDIYGPTSGDISTYDTAIHFSVAGGSETIIQLLKSAGVKLILWPNLWFTLPPSQQQINNIQAIVLNFDAIVFRSTTEAIHCQTLFDLSRAKIIRCECIVSQKFLNHDVTDIFGESYGIREYAIWPGIVEPIKNQLAAIRAFRDINFNLVISGRIRDHEYMNVCKREAGPNVHFIPAMPFGSELHVSALRYSKIFIELPLDFPGTSAVEALAVGCNLLLSNTEWTAEIIGKECTMVDPLDVEAISSAVGSMSDLSPRQKPIDRSVQRRSPALELISYLKN